MAEDKREESMMLLKQTKVMEEIGTKGEADVAQMQANFAADDYEVTRQKGLLENALLALKQQMNFPTDEELFIANDVIIPNTHIVLEQDILTLVETGSELPLIKQARYNLQSAEYSYRASKGALFPSLSLGAGMSTAYNKQLGNADTRSFREQFRNNTGRNVYASISIPIFNRLSTLTSIRRARNNVARAKENLDHQQDELRRLIQGTIIEKENYRKETEKMTKKVESDSIASRLTIRKYEEGLASPIEVKTAGVTLLQSKAQLLQCQLMYAYKSRILEYYKGIPLWTE